MTGPSPPPLGRAVVDRAVVDRSLEVETPEHVAVGYELAGPGSRFLAFLLDGVLIQVALVLLFVGMLLILVASRSVGAPPPAFSTVVAVVFLSAFALVWGYFIYFEGFRDGRTPGKKWMGLRVVQEGGFPITLRESVIRNLIRVIDIQPMPSCILGGGMILLHGKAQRLGDIAAGTVVIRERAVAVLPEEGHAEGAPRLSEQEYELLRAYLLRRETLEGAARRRLDPKLAGHLARHGESSADPAAFLSALYAAESGRRRAAGADVGSGSPAAALLFRQQSGRWREYEALLERARGSLPSLPEEEVSRFAGLYREIATDLARARTYGASPELLFALERSVGTGHNLLYSAPRRTTREAWQWLRVGLPVLVRRRRRVILAAALLLFGPGLVTFGAVVVDPGVARMIVPAEMRALAEQAEERAARGVGYAEVPEYAMPLFSSTIIANNVQVSFFAFAGGILAGLGTLLILVANGVHLGGVTGVFHAEGAGLYLWSFVAPHGVIELTAICIAGGAGLWMGSALILPGRQTRRDALVLRAREAVSLLGGTVVLLLVAGLVEGFVSPSRLPDGFKLAFGALTAPLLFSYLLLAGREHPPVPDEPGGRPR